MLQHIGIIDRPPEVAIFLYIYKIAIVVFIPIYLALADLRYLEEVLNCKINSKVNFKNADTYKVRIFLN